MRRALAGSEESAVTIPNPRHRACVPRSLRTASALGAAALVALTMAACGGGTTASSGGLTVSTTGQVPVKPTPHGGTLTIARTADETTLNPLNGITSTEDEAVDVDIFDTLVELLPGKSGYQPGLATSWTASPDGLTYTFELRAAKFSNGQPVTPRDVVFSLRTAQDPKLDANYASLLAPMKGIDVTGPSEITIKLSRPTPGLLGYLSFPPTSIVPQSVYQKLGAAKFAVHPVGSGAFKVQSFVKGQGTVLVRNPYYWRTGLPYVDKVKLVDMPDDNARVLALRSGSVDIAEGVPFSQLQVVAKDPKLKLLIANAGILQTGGFFNERVKPLGEKLVRLALNYATPRDAISKSVYLGLAQPANSVLPAVDDWDPSVKPYPYDLAKAKALLAKSSVPHGFSVQLTIVGTDQQSRAVAQILQSSWAKIGVKLTIRSDDGASEFADIAKGNFQMLAFPAGGSDSPTPDELMGSLIVYDILGSAYHNQQVKGLAAQAIGASTAAEHHRLVQEFQRLALTDPFDVPIVFPPVRAGMKKTVHGFGYVTSSWYRFDETSIG